jgi:hypothetical protein
MLLQVQAHDATYCCFEVEGKQIEKILSPGEVMLINPSLQFSMNNT